MSKVQNKPSSNIYFEDLFNDDTIEWNAISMPSSCVTYNSYMRSFQYKILSNALFLNKKLHTLEESHLHCVLSVIYTTKHLFTYFMTVTVSNF